MCSASLQDAVVITLYPAGGQAIRRGSARRGDRDGKRGETGKGGGGAAITLAPGELLSLFISWSPFPSVWIHRGLFVGGVAGTPCPELYFQPKKIGSLNFTCLAGLSVGVQRTILRVFFSFVFIMVARLPS